MKKLTLGILTVVSLFLASCVNEFHGCGIVKEKYITSDGGGYLVIELQNSRRVLVGGQGTFGMDKSTWANAKIGEKYCQ